MLERIRVGRKLILSTLARKAAKVLACKARLRVMRSPSPPRSRKSAIALAAAIFFTAIFVWSNVSILASSTAADRYFLKLRDYPPPNNLISSSDDDHHPHPTPSSSASSPSSSSSPPSSAASCSPDAALKVFMYQLPPEFHFGMLDGSLKSSNRLWPQPLPRYPGGLYMQHSPEYWLTADLLARMNSNNSSSSSSSNNNINSSCSVRLVTDPSAADVFFVPFFSSLSYNKYVSGPDKNPKENDRLEMALVDYLRRQPAWKKHGGRDHIIVMHHPNSLRLARTELRDAMFIVADFGRYQHGVANVDKDIVAPYKHVVPTFVNDHTTFDSRPTLLYFQGAIVRKEGGIIRQQLYDLLHEEPDVHFATGSAGREGFRSSTAGMRSSKFCLHPAGDTPSSNRLFDAIASHCVPVVVSDELELPFEDVLDYSEFSVFVDARRATTPGVLLKLLRGVSREEWRRKWERLKQVERHFEYAIPSTEGDAVDMLWKAVARRLPLLRLKQHRYIRMQHSSRV